VEARWSGDADLDVSVTTPSGTRLAASAPTGSSVRLVDRQLGGVTETLAVPSARAGTYLVEIQRYRGQAGAADLPIRGEIVIRALRGPSRVFPFELRGPSTRVAEVAISRPAPVWR
jgi:hypothetical protein